MTSMGSRGQIDGVTGSRSVTGQRAAIALSAIIPAILVAVHCFVLRPLNWGLGLAEGWDLLFPQAPLVVAGLVWVLLVAAVVAPLALMNPPTTTWRVLRRATAAFSVVFWVGYPLVISFMQLAVEYVDRAPVLNVSAVTGVLVVISYYAAFILGPAVVLSLLLEGVVAFFRGRSDRRRAVAAPK